MKSLLRTLPVFVSAISALSAFAAIGAHADCAQGCNQPPVSTASQEDGFSLQEAQALYEAGSAPTQAQLLGRWTMVGVAAVPGEPDSNLVDSYQSSGIKNSDGSPYISLEFQISGVGQTDFGGNPVPEALSVTLQNLGDDTNDQGPSDVDLISASSACFAQYDYGGSGNGGLLKSHGNYSCRVLAQDSGKMVCSVALFIDPSEASGMSAAFNDWNGKIEAYFAYVKASSPAN